jgi:hypothetical protein
MRRWLVVMGSIALAFGVASATAGPSGAATAPKAIPGATYSATGTKLVVNVDGTTVRVISVPVDAKCSPAGPNNSGDFSPEGLGPFPIEHDGSFTDVAKGEKPGSNQTVIRGTFSGSKVSGTVVVPAIRDTVKDFKCEKYSGPWSAARDKGTGDTTKPGATYAKDDFSNPKSGFAVYNGESSYAEYLKDGRFRIGTRKPTAAISLRDEPVTATADISVTTGFTSGSGSDSVGLVCLGTDPKSFVAGYVSLDGNADLLRYANGDVAESAPKQPLPAGLLHTGEQAQNDLRLTCSTTPDDADKTDVALYLNGTKVAEANANRGGAGKVGLLVGSARGTTEFRFSDLVLRKPS